MVNNDVLETVINDTENVMNDIFLSGFYSVQPAVLEKLQHLGRICEKAGMEKGASLLLELRDELNKGSSSFDYSSTRAASLFCTLEFYIQNAKDLLG